MSKHFPKMQQRRRVLASLFALALLPKMSVAQTKPASSAASVERKSEWAVPVSSAHNLFRITPNFFRSARLKRRDVPLLQELGIKTVVSLRAFHSDEEVLEHTNIKLQRVPMLTWAIGDKEIIAALRAIKEAEKDGAVLLHCQHGADRTGLVAAMYRIVFMGWQREHALEELLNGGYGYHSMWKNIVKYLRNVDGEKIKQALL